MNIFKNLLARVTGTPENTTRKTFILVLDLVENEIGSSMFPLIKEEIRKFLENPKISLLEALQNGQPPKVTIYTVVAGITARHLQSGEFHVWRGVLNMAGEEIHKIHFMALEKMPSNDPANREAVIRKRKDEMLEAIKYIG